jgi:NADPH:quinone reductase
MKALLSIAPGGPETLVLVDQAEPVAGPAQLLVEVKAVGVNFPDTLIIRDYYQYKPKRPFAPGAEFAGIVRAVGACAGPFEVCDRVVALSGWGAMAERVSVDASRCIKLPEWMPFDEAAALLMTYGTSYYALRHRAALRAGDRLLVLGAAGGIGSAAVEIAKAMGARVLAAASSREKIAFAIEAGADAALVYSAGGLDRTAQKEFSSSIRTASGGAVDVILDSVGGSYSEPALRAMEWEGRFLVVGFPAGIASLPLNLPLLKSCQIIGVFFGAYFDRNPQSVALDMQALFELHRTRQIRPRISRRFPLAAGGEAIRDLAERRALGKIIVEVNGG